MDVQFTADGGGVGRGRGGKIEWGPCSASSTSLQEEPGRGGSADARCQARGEAHRSLLRKVRQPDGDQVGRMGRFLAVPATPTARTPRTSSKRTDRSKWSRTCPPRDLPTCGKRWSTSGAGSAASSRARTTRPADHPAITLKGVVCPDDGGGLAERNHASQELLRLRELPELQVRRLGSAIPGPCPQCGKPYLLQKYTKRDGAFMLVRTRLAVPREAPEPGRNRSRPKHREWAVGVRRNARSPPRCAHDPSTNPLSPRGANPRREQPARLRTRRTKERCCACNRRAGGCACHRGRWRIATGRCSARSTSSGADWPGPSGPDLADHGVRVVLHEQKPNGGHPPTRRTGSPSWSARTRSDPTIRTTRRAAARRAAAAGIACAGAGGWARVPRAMRWQSIGWCSAAG